MECQYCKRTFSNKSNLNNHQKNAKYCLKIQGKISIKMVINLKCSICNKEFNQKGNLDRHYKKCKKSKQLEKINVDTIKKTCDYCYKEFSTRQSLSKHKLQRCIFLQLEDKDKECKKQLEEYKKQLEEYKKQLEEYKKQLEDKDKECKKQLEDKDKEYKQKLEDKDKEYKQRLEDKEQKICRFEDKLENIALKNSSNHTTINNNQKIMIDKYIANMEPITPEMLLSYADNLTEEHVLNGRKGIAKYVSEHPMKGNVLCTDISRKKIKYKDAKGNIQTDVNMSKLKKGIFISIQPRFGTIKDNIDKSDRFKIDPNLSLGDQRYLEKIHWKEKCNIVNTLVDLSEECKGNTDTELGQIVTKKILELSNL